MAAAEKAALFFILDELCEDDIERQIPYEEADGEILIVLLADGAQRPYRNRVRVGEYFERVVPMYSASEFRSHFRMSRGTVEFLHGLLGVLPELPQHQTHGGRPPVPLQKQILLSLWVLGNPECLRSGADRFDVTRSSAYRISRRICKAIALHLSGQFIKFPCGQRAREVRDKFEEMRGFPGVMGAIDGCHIPVKGPRENPEQYINRKGFHSVQLQVVCDESMHFTDVFCGYPGSVHDARVFRNSPLYHDAEADPRQLFPGNTHLIGDAAYPLKSWILTPFNDNGRLTRSQKRYNFVHSSTRMVVERSLALLKGIRKLKPEMDISRIGDVPEIVVASCVLHNICLMSEDDIGDFFDNECNDGHDDEHNDIFPPEAEGADKRNEIVRHLAYTGEAGDMWTQWRF